MPTSPRFLPASGFDVEDARQRIGSILRALDATDPGARTALEYRNPFELLISTILSAQSTDATVNRVAPALFARFGTPEALAGADPAEVEELVKATGFFRQKTKAIVGCAKELVERFEGEVPRSVDALTSLPGVARKTANVVLSNCCPRPASDHGIFVDTHVHRVSQRLALTGQDVPEKIERELQQVVPQEKWADFPHQLTDLGRGACNAKAPRHAECPLLQWCPTGQAAMREGAPSTPPKKPRVARPRK